MSARAIGTPAATQRSQNPDTMSVSDVPARPAWVSHSDNSAKSFTPRLYSHNVRLWHQAAVRECPLFHRFSGLSGHRPSTADRSRFYEYTPFCNGPGDVKSPRVIVTPPSSRFCPWLALRPPHYAVRRNGEPI